jgi:hypothetical protein
MSQLDPLLIFFADKSFVAWPDIPAELHAAWRVARKRGLLAADYGGWGPDAERHECYRHLCKYSLTESGKDALAELRISQAAVEKKTPPDALVTIWFHGEQSYSTDEKTPINVSNEQHNALKAFLDKNQALDTPALEKAGITNVSKVMTALDKRFPGAVQKPQHKGDGYYIRVRSLTPTR